MGFILGTDDGTNVWIDERTELGYLVCGYNSLLNSKVLFQFYSQNRTKEMILKPW